MSAVESAVLLAAALIYTGAMVLVARTSAGSSWVEKQVRAASDAADAAGAPSTSGPWRAGLSAAAWLGVLLIRSHLFIAGAVASARALGISERVVGLTVVAPGTLLPELVASDIAAYRGHSDLAVGNVVGSNIFNVFLCLGAAGLAGPMVATLESVQVEIVALLVITGLAASFIRSERTVTRVEGILALLLFVGFMLVTLLANGRSGSGRTGARPADRAGAAEPCAAGLRDGSSRWLSPCAHPVLRTGALG